MTPNGDHTAALPIHAAPTPPQTDEDAERRRRRRPARRPKTPATPTPASAPPPQAALDVPASSGPRPSRSMPPPARPDPRPDAAGTRQSCPLLPTPSRAEPRGPVVGTAPGGAPRRLFFQPHWADHAVEDALKRGTVFTGKLRVNAHNRNEAYCTIDGIPVDILITGTAQNRAIEGDVVAITVDPVVYWTRMKGQNITPNPASGGVSVSREVSETNGNHSLKKGQADASCRFEKCSNGQPVPDSMHSQHKNSSFSQAVMCENGHAIVPENHEGLDEGNTESARALQRICSVICSHPSRRPTGKVVSVIKKSPRRGAVVGFLAPFSEFPDGEQRNQMNMQGSKRMNHIASSSLTGLVHLLPTDPKFPQMIVSVSTLPDSIRQRLKEGDIAIEKELVGAQIDDWNEESPYPWARVLQLFGKGGQVETHMDAILFENEICSTQFSSKSMACLPDMSWKIPQEELAARKDLRNVLTFTIDPPTASDLDDAISIETLSGGIVRIGVHIADVSYFVHPETTLDAEAQMRSTSVYTLRRKVSMLPSRLSEELVSLNPGVDRLAFSVIWDIDPCGSIVNRWIGRTIIFSCCKLSYDLVQDLISSDANQFRSAAASLQVHGMLKQEDIIKSLRCLYEISKNLKDIRFKAGALSLDTSKPMILFDEDGAPCDSYRYKRNDACFIVEELMLLANMAAAEVISNAFPDCALLRKHPEPNPRKLREFEAFCAKNGFELDSSSSGQLHLSICRIKEELQDDPVMFDILMFYASKQMQSAEYFCTGDVISKDDWAHYALSVPLYTHFTSPLRRYPDIIVHRTLSAVLEAEQMYLKHREISTGRNGVKIKSCETVDRCFTGLQFSKDAAETKSCETVDRCFTGLQFSKDAAETKEGREALSAAAKKFMVPNSDCLGGAAEYCNERKWASRRAEEAGQKLYMWALLKRNETMVSNARVLGVGPRFMSVYVPKLSMERRIYYDEVEGLSTEWLEATGTLVLDACRNKPAQRRGSQFKCSRAIEEVAVVVNPSELILSEDKDEPGAIEAGGPAAADSVLLSDDAVKADVAPAALPLVIRYLSDIPVVLHAIGGEDSPVDIGVRLYISSYFK